MKIKSKNKLIYGFGNGQSLQINPSNINNKMSITTYGIALTSGKKGDMITVENLKSKKTFKAIVLDEKKVTPLTNM